MASLRWIVCIGLGAPTALVLLGNWLAFLGTIRSGKATSFGLPFLAGPACALACLLCPEARVRALAWCPLALDLSLWALAWAALTGQLVRPADEPPPRRDDNA